jgi:7-cyano-7-deazaguanine reductase
MKTPQNKKKAGTGKGKGKGPSAAEIADQEAAAVAPEETQEEESQEEVENESQEEVENESQKEEHAEEEHAEEEHAEEERPAPEKRNLDATKQEDDVIKTSLLRIFKHGSKNQLVEIETDEFTAINPFNGGIEFATVRIEYYPKAEKAVELGSLKKYLSSYRNIKIHQEAVTSRIWADIRKAIGNNQLTVQTIYTSREGMDMTCTESGMR